MPPNDTQFHSGSRDLSAGASAFVCACVYLCAHARVSVCLKEQGRNGAFSMLIVLSVEFRLK